MQDSVTPKTRERQSIPRWQRVYLSACAWVIGFAATYSAAQWGEWPKLTYFPLAEKWELWSTPPGPLPMAYLGLIVWGVCGGLVAAALAWILSGRLWALGPQTLRLFGGWALAAFVISGLFFTWNLWPF